MKTQYLFPNAYKRIGWFLFIPASILGFLWILTDFGIINFYPSFLDLQIWALIAGDLKGNHVGTIIENNLANELLGVMFLVGGILVAFSKEKYEDEFIAQIRLESLVWATYVNYGFLLLSLLLVYGFAFLTVMLFNMFTLLIFFIVRFHFSLYQVNHSYQLHEK